MIRTIHQRRAYALRRLSAAVDRVILARDIDEKARAAAWANVWGRRAGVAHRE